MAPSLVSVDLSQFRELHTLLVSLLLTRAVFDNPLSPFPALHAYPPSFSFTHSQLKRVPINTLTGLQRLREQLQVLKIQRSHITSLDVSLLSMDIISIVIVSLDVVSMAQSTNARHVANTLVQATTDDNQF